MKIGQPQAKKCNTVNFGAFLLVKNMIFSRYQSATLFVKIS